MESITQNTVTSNRLFIQPRRRSRAAHSREILFADIKVSNFKDTFAYTVVIRHKDQVVFPHFCVLCPDENVSAARTWLLAYQRAWTWADENMPDARLFITEAREEWRRNKAA